MATQTNDWMLKMTQFVEVRNWIRQIHTPTPSPNASLPFDLIEINNMKNSTNVLFESS